MQKLLCYGTIFASQIFTNGGTGDAARAQAFQTFWPVAPSVTVAVTDTVDLFSTPPEGGQAHRISQLFRAKA